MPMIQLEKPVLPGTMPVVWPTILDLGRDECKRILRKLELEAYAGVISALRAQGDLTKDKKDLLGELTKILGISTERHRAEVRRAVNDERLTTIAYHDSIIASIPWSHIENVRSSSLDSLSPSPSASRALKLLYISCSDAGIQQRDIVTNWEVNSIGHPLVLPVKVCEELQQVMDESNATLPVSLKCMQSYQVAYLRLCVPSAPCEDGPTCGNVPCG